MIAYYNEHDKNAAAWLRELIKAGEIAPGEVDERSIVDVRADDLRRFRQCHFFAGVGGWSLALRLAGVPDAAAVWTGSAPCQPFSVAGQQLGADDDRHLWPELFRLIRECGPRLVFGEQVASSAVLGSAAKPSKRRPVVSAGIVWLDGVFADLESAQYACGAADIPAAGLGAPHIRQRAWWVAHRNVGGCEVLGWPKGGAGLGPERVADVLGARLEGHTGHGDHRNEPGRLGAEPAGPAATSSGAGGNWSSDNGLADPGHESTGRSPGCGEAQSGRTLSDVAGCSPWSAFDLIPCRDGKARRVPLRTESLFFDAFDGVSDLLADRWDAVVAQLGKEIIYGQTSTHNPGETLRSVWRHVSAETLHDGTGGPGALPSSAVLLVTLCELARGPQSMLRVSAPDFASLREATMRTLWRNSEAARPSQKRGLEGPPTGKSPDAVHSLPPWRSQSEGQEVQSLLREAQGPRAVPEAFSAVEKVWRSALNEKAGAKWIQAGAGFIIAAEGFPLAPSIQGRAALLRGFGNAIVPQVAATFIRASLEALP